MKLPALQNKRTLIKGALALVLVLSLGVPFLPASNVSAHSYQAADASQCEAGHTFSPGRSGAPGICSDEDQGNAISNAIGWVISKILYAFGGFIGLLLSWETALIGVVLNPNFFGGYTKVDGVRIGWTITRDLANLGLVLALIVIAIGTILRLESYGMRRTLWRLIVVAILINFSLLIGGIIIDAANLITYFFVNANSNNPNACHLDTYPQCFAQAFRIIELIQKTRSAGGNMWQALFGTGGSLLIVISSILFVISFSLVALIVLGALVVMLVARVVWLWILLILAPIAWVSYIFPSTQKSWNEWWGRFIKWSFFAPIVSFFIYLSFQIIFRLGNVDPTKGFLSWEGFFGNQGAQLLQTGSAPGWILQFAVFIGLLIASLKVANDMAGGVAGQALSLATFAAKAPATIAAQLARRTALTAGQRVERGQVTTSADRLAQRMISSRLLAPIGRPISRAITAFQVEQAQAVREQIGKVKDFDPKLLAREAQLPGIAGMRALHALAQGNNLDALEKAGLKSSDIRRLITSGLSHSITVGLSDATKGYVKYAPDLYQQAGFKDLAAVAKLYGKEDIEKISEDSWRTITAITEMVGAIQQTWGASKFQAVADRGGVLYERLRERHRQLGADWLSWYQKNNRSLGQYLLKNKELWDLPEPPKPPPTPPAAPQIITPPFK